MKIVFKSDFRKIILHQMQNDDIDLNSVNVKGGLDDMVRTYIINNRNVLNMMYVIISNNDEFRIHNNDSVKVGNEYYVSCTLTDLFKQTRQCACNKDRDKFEIYKKLIVSNIPDCLLAELQVLTVTSFPHNRIKLEKYIDKVDSCDYASIFSYDALDKLEAFIMRNKGIIDSHILSNLCRFSLRIYAPKYSFDEARKFLYWVNQYDSIYDDKILIMKNRLVHEFKKTEIDDPIMKEKLEEKARIDNYIWLRSHNTMYISSNTVCKNVLTMNIFEWGRLINHMTQIEKDYSHPAFSFIYYALKDYKNIQSLMNVNLEAINNNLR